MVVCQPPFSMPLLSSPSPEKLPNENVLLVGETSRWSSCSRKGTPILLGRLFPVWWNGIEPFLSRSSLRLLNYIHERRRETQDKGDTRVSTGCVRGRGLAGRYWVSSSNRENVTRMLMEGGELSKMIYFLEVFLLGEFEHGFSQRRPWTISSSILWELVKNCSLQLQPQTSLTSKIQKEKPGDLRFNKPCGCFWSLKHTQAENPWGRESVSLVTARFCLLWLCSAFQVEVWLVTSLFTKMVKEDT